MQKSLRFIVCFVALLLASFAIQAQAPQKFSYQAVVRNASNALVRNTPVGVRISIFQYTAGGTLKFQETHTPTTNDNGLFTVEIGGGTPGSGNIAIIDWGDGPYFLRSEVDFNNDATYDLTADQQLLAVPYALHCNEYQDLADIVTKGNHAGMKQLKDVQDPTQPQDAVTKHYLDSVVAIVSALSGARVKDTAATKCVSFLWPRNGRTYTSSGLYLDTIENACGAGCDTVVALRLTIVDGPAVTLGEISSSLGTSTCAGSPATLTANVTASTGVLSYAWTRTAGATLTADNTASVTTNNLESGSNTYSVTVTATVAGCGTTNASKNITISGTTASAVTLNDIAGTSAICLGGNTTLTASPSASTGTVSYAWSASPSGTAGMSATTGAAITATPTATGTHRYTVTATAHQDGCADANDSKWIDVSVEAAPAVALGTLTSSEGTTICVEHATTLALGAGTSEGSVSYSWEASPSANSGLTSDNVSSLSVTPAAAGTYVYTVSATATKSGCASANDSKTVTVTVNALPTLVLGKILSNGDGKDIDGLNTTSHTLTANITTPDPLPGSGISYQWYKNSSIMAGETNSTLDITTGGVYKVIVTYNNGTCSTSQEKEITICETPDQPVITSTSGTSPITICSGSSANLKVSDATYNGAYTYTWKRGVSTTVATTPANAGSSSYSASVAGSYTVIATNALTGCEAYTATSDGFSISVIDPSFTLANPTASPSPVDQDATLTLSVTEPTVSGSLAYKWGTTSGGNNLGTTRSVSGSGGNFTGTAGSKTFYLTVTHTLSGCSTSQNKTVSVTVNTADCGYSSITQTGAIKGVFTVGATRRVLFAKGNLYYYATESIKWKLAPNQYAYIGNNAGNTNPSSSQSSPIDLFGSGTDGTGSYPPYLAGSYADVFRLTTAGGTGDWCYNNTLYTSDNSSMGSAHTWRILTKAEWEYLLNTRTNAAKLRGHGTVNGQKGLIILPDCWVDPKTNSLNSGNFSATYENNNTYSASAWSSMEANGAVFLPAAGRRTNKSVNYSSAQTSSCSGYYYCDGYFMVDSPYLASGPSFTAVSTSKYSGNAHYGCAVRPVKNY